MKYLYIGGLPLILAWVFWNWNAMELARDGKTDYAIIQGTNATSAEKFAAEELGEFLGKVTGAKFALISETNQPLPKKAIYVGWTDAASKIASLNSLGPESWIIKTKGRNLILAGGRPRGTLYAVYEFLEQQLGCHWLDEFTEVVPVRPVLTLGRLDLAGQPAFWYRAIYSTADRLVDPQLLNLFNSRNKSFHPGEYSFSYSRLIPTGKAAEAAARLGYGPEFGAPGFPHTFYEYSRDWPTNHPEYWALNRKGERVISTNAGTGQLCLTHPEVRKLMLAKLRQYIARDREKAAQGGVPYPRVYDVSANDTHWICQCPDCKAFSEREGSDSGPLIDLVNSLADGIKAEYPDVLVQTFAYSNTLKPPATIRPHDNVIIRIAQLNAEYASDARGKTNWSPEWYPDLFHPLTNAINRGACELLISWSKIARHLACWDYWIQFHEIFPNPYVNIAGISSDLKLFGDNRVEMMFVECELPETTSFSALKYWLGLKLMQNPRRDAEPLIQAFMAGYYGPAAGKMREYLAYLEQRIASVPGTKKMSAMETFERPYLDPELFITSERMLDQAEALCGTNRIAMLHVWHERIPVDAALYCMWDQLQAALSAGKALPFDREAIIRRYEAVRLEQMETFRAKDKLEDGKKKLEEELTKFRTLPARNQLKVGNPA